MGSYLDKLRAKPIHERKRIAVFSTGAIFSTIVVVWWITFTSPVDEQTVATANVISPIGVLANVAVSAKDGFYALPSKLMNDMHFTASGTDASATRMNSDVVYSDQIPHERAVDATGDTTTPQTTPDDSLTIPPAPPQAGQ